MHHFSAEYTADGWPAIALHVAIGLIIVGYFVIAAQFWRRRKSWKRPRAVKAFIQLMFIFIFCSASGYVPRLIDVNIWLFIALHIILASATWWYILSCQAMYIAEAMDRNEHS